MKKQETPIVAFHIGRGGRFNNAGHKTYLGEKNFRDLINLNSDNCFEYNRDEKGRFCKPYLTNGNGSFITDDDLNGEVGILNFDYDYDTDYCKYIEECDENELQTIIDSNQWDRENVLEAYAAWCGFTPQEINLMARFNDYQAVIYCAPTFKDGKRVGYIYQEECFTAHTSNEGLKEYYLELGGKFYTKD